MSGSRASGLAGGARGPGSGLFAPRRRGYGGGYGWGRRRRYGHDPYYHGGDHYHQRRSPLGAVLGCVAALFFGVIVLVIVFFALLL